MRTCVMGRPLEPIGRRLAPCLSWSMHGRSSRRVIIHDRGIWKLGEYLCGETAGFVRVILRDRRELKPNQRFAFGSKCAPVGLEQKGFAGAVDIIKVSNKEDFCTVPNCPKIRRQCKTPGLRPAQLGVRLAASLVHHPGARRFPHKMVLRPA